MLQKNTVHDKFLQKNEAIFPDSSIFEIFYSAFYFVFTMFPVIVCYVCYFIFPCDVRIIL